LIFGKLDCGVSKLDCGASELFADREKALPRHHHEEGMEIDRGVVSFLSDVSQLSIGWELAERSDDISEVFGRNRAIVCCMNFACGGFNRSGVV
jgi:hypothetical protein